MARTKQTARKSTGGRAPRRQLALSSSSSMRHYFSSQQAAGGRPNSGIGGKKKIFVNYENTFGEFKFKRLETRETFCPGICVGRVSLPSMSSASEEPRKEELLMRLDFTSCMDGKESVIHEARPPLDAVFVVDISGSMTRPFEGDTDGRSKYKLAAECIEEMLKKFSSRDRAAIVTFNTAAEVQTPLNFTTAAHKTRMSRKLKNINVCGGTALANGLRTGYEHIKTNSLKRPGNEETRMQRVFFLTDMQSSFADEEEVLSIATKEASLQQWLSKPKLCDIPEEPDIPVSNSSRKRKSVSSAPVEKKQKAQKTPVFLNLIGVGVDLSVSTVEQLSSIPGAKYLSVTLASEMRQTVAGEFSFDITPLAFNIKVTMPQNLSIHKVYGSAELNSLRRNSKSAVISSEFPTPLDDDGQCNGGIYLFKLEEKGSTSREIPFKVSWLNIDGSSGEKTCLVRIPPPLTNGLLESRNCDTGLMKARVLVEYVDNLSDYMTMEESCSMPIENTALRPEGFREIASDAMKQLQEGTLKEEDIHLAIPDEYQKHMKHAIRFQRLKQYVSTELEACGDTTLATTNKNIEETLTQIIDVEIKESTALLDTLTSSISTQGIPNGMLCPITLEIMTDPVIASDGNSYERKAIENWLRTHRPKVSPLTNMPLTSDALIVNRSLKAAIDEFRQKKSSWEREPEARAP